MMVVILGPMPKELDRSSKPRMWANHMKAFQSEEHLEFSLQPLCCITNRSMWRVFELPIWTIAKCTRVTTTMMIEEDEVQTRMVLRGSRT